jgi:hypothetical protein
LLTGFIGADGGAEDKFGRLVGAVGNGGGLMNRTLSASNSFAGCQAFALVAVSGEITVSGPKPGSLFSWSTS